MRTILFAQVNSQKEDITSLLTESGPQLALSDEQLQEVDRHLLVRNMEEYQEKFGQNFEDPVMPDFSPCGTNRKDRALEFAHRLEKYGKDCYEIWYSHGHTAISDETIAAEYDKKSRKQEEIYLGIQAFFRQAGAGRAKGQTELLVLNISVEGLLENPVELAKLEKYLETVNHKQHLSDRIDYAVLPETVYVSRRTKIRERFQGNNNTEKQPGTVSAEMADRLLTVLGRYGVVVLYQYETCAETSAQAFAVNGVSPYKQAAARYESHAYAEYISCCYPNLTSPREGMYIGAAYVAAAMLSADEDEGSITEFPKEVYPYSRQTKNDIAREKFGCLLAAQTNAPGWGAVPNMVMLSSRTCKRIQGLYTQIKK